MKYALVGLFIALQVGCVVEQVDSEFASDGSWKLRIFECQKGPERVEAFALMTGSGDLTGIQVGDKTIPTTTFSTGFGPEDTLGKDSLVFHAWLDNKNMALEMNRVGDYTLIYVVKDPAAGPGANLENYTRFSSEDSKCDIYEPGIKTAFPIDKSRPI